MIGVKEFAIGLAMRAGNILIQDFRQAKPTEARFKSKRELVTKLDIKVNNFLVKKIKESYPDHCILSEESGCDDAKKKSKYQWVIDPLDGTVNYTMRNTFFTTNIALLEDGEPILGVIYAPYTRELYVAEKGRGVKKNEVKIKVSTTEDLSDAFLTFGYGHQKESMKRAMNVYQSFETAARSMRHFGSSSLQLAFVAIGRTDAEIITPPVRLWDVAAGILMIKEAGGKVTDFKGDETNITKGGLVASNGLVHDQILKVIKKKKI